MKPFRITGTTTIEELKAIPCKMTAFLEDDENVELRTVDVIDGADNMHSASDFVEWLEDAGWNIYCTDVYAVRNDSIVRHRLISFQRQEGVQA